MDDLDTRSVRLYRAGLAASALGLVAIAAGGLASAGVGAALIGPGGAAAARAAYQVGGPLLCLAGSTLSVANMHLYDKRIRWLIAMAGWLGPSLTVGGLTASSPEVGRWLWHAGLGFVFVVLSAFALKEQFCFRIPLLRLVPAFLALSLIPMLAKSPDLAGLLALGAAIPYCLLVVAKERMPPHFDVGDKSRYQI